MAIYIEILEVGSNVVVSGSGSANTASLTSNPTSDQGANIIADINLVTLYGSVNSSVDEYLGIPSISANMGPGDGGPNYSFNRTGNNSFGISELGTPLTVRLYLPVGYVSGSELGVSTSQYNSQDFNTLGLNTGTYTWSWGTGEDADSLTIQVGPSEPTPTPTPTSTATPTPTPSSTPTPTPTSTSTPTPTPSSSPVTTTTTTEPMIVKSANTEYVECRICDDVAQTQNTPHPVYTDNKGNEVIQMNAVVIGGNGLNA